MKNSILVKALNDLSLGAGFMWETTALPKDRACFIEVLKE